MRTSYSSRAQGFAEAPEASRRSEVIVIVIVVAVMVLPWVALAVLLLIGVVFPEVRRKGIRQLRQPFALRSEGFVSEYRLNKRRHELEDEVIRRFSPSREKPHPHD